MIITLLTGTTSKIEQKIFEQTGITLKAVRNCRARKLSLKIDSKTKIPTLSLPTFCTAKSAVSFIVEHQEWIKNKLNKIPDAKEFENSEQISIFGKQLTIKHSPDSRSGVFIKNDELIVSGNLIHLHRRVIDFIKKEAGKQFSEISRQKAKLINCKINKVFIKDTKSRWGSCSSLSNINYNWRIALAPYFVIEYLVCHEVSHLAHQDHSADFWQCVKNLYPDYKKGQDWLKNNSKTLYKYK